MSRFTVLLSFVIAFTVCITFVHAAQGGEVVLVPLTSNWSLRSTSENATTVFYPVTVPNTVVGALLELNDVQVAAGAPSMFNFPDGGTDPFYGKNLEGIPTANFTVPWTFSTTFTVPTTSATKDDTAALYYVLQLNGINYAATVSINNVQVDEGKVIGGIRRFVLDVDAILNTTGPNALSLTLTPPLNSWSTDLSFSFLDWAPFPADNSMGIWRDVNLLGLPRFQTLSQPPQAVAFLADGISVNTYLPSAVSSASQPAYITIQITVRCFPLDACNNVTTGQVALSLVVQTTCPGIETLALPLCNTTTFTPSDDGDSGEARFVYSWEQNSALVMQDPPLWWPWQMGDQPLFRLYVQLENYNISTPGGHQFGLRQMTQTETQGGACQLLVNNIPLLIRGAGWAPDLFYRIVQNTAGGNESRIQHQLEMVRHMNLNTIRLEGKFEYANFFEIASELGILVIPGIECCTSWQNWPNWTASMTDIARRSVRDQARRLAHYACNVAFLESSDELPPQAVEEMYRTVLLEEAWPNALIAAASEQESNISGSTGVKMTGPYSWIPPVYWLGDTNGITLDYGGAWGFLTEGGPGEAPMTFASWARTVPQEHLWNASEGGSMSSWWNAHMGNPLGVFGNLRRYTPPLDARFGASSSAQEYCYKAQLQNYEGIRAMFEGYSLMKHANATGVIQWMLNDAYPNHLWHLYDYYLVAGGGYYGAKAAGEPIHALLSYVDGTVALINNRFTDAMGPYTVTVKAFAVVPTFAEFYASEPYSVSILPSDAALTLFAVDLAQLNFLAKEAAPQPNGTATPYLVQLEVTTGATYMPVTSSWYIMSTRMDAVNWTDGNNLWSNCSQWADFTMLQDAPKAEVAFLDVTMGPAVGYVDRVQVSATLINTSPAAVAMFSHVSAVCSETGLELAPAFWNDNFVTLLPSTNKTLQATIYRGSCLSVELRVDSYPAMGTNTARWTLV